MPWSRRIELTVGGAYKAYLPSLFLALVTVFFDALRSQLGVALLVPLLATVGAFLINYVQAWLVVSPVSSPTLVDTPKILMRA